MLASGKNAKFSPRCKILNSMQNSQILGVPFLDVYTRACHCRVIGKNVIRWAARQNVTISRDSSVAASQPAATDRRLCARPSRIQRGARGYLGRRGCHGVHATHIFVSVRSSPFEPHERRAQLDGTANGAPRLRRVRQHPGRHPPLRANASATVVMGHRQAHTGQRTTASAPHSSAVSGFQASKVGALASQGQGLQSCH